MSSGFIRRPVATGLLMVAIVLLGVTAYTLLPVAALPNVSFPTISVTAQLPGADPQTMASSVATPLEKQFGEIPYLTQMTSTSSTGYTQITLQFALNDDINAAAQLVQTAINAAAGQLPKDMPSPPTYHETNPADAPVLVLGLTSDTLPITTVDDYAESIIAQKISQVPGVGLVGIGGEQHPAIRVQLDPAKLAANGLDLEDVRNALTNVSVDQPKGSLYGNQRAYTLQTNDQILNAQGWNNQIIAYRNGGPIRVSDVGKAIVGPQDETLRGWVNQQRGIVLAIQRLPGANVIGTVDAIKAALPQIETAIPPAIKVSVISDRTITIRASVADVQNTLILTIGLVVGVIFLFLRSVWATLIPAVAVPVSIIGTFGVMYLCGYSLDNLSLMGLSIAVGFVVDDAIVMVENIARHIEMGKTPLRAALDGAGEIGFTILSISISLVAVFIPLLMMGGMVGRMFQEFAVTVTVAIAVSVVVSLTLTPMMGARLLRDEHPEQAGKLSRALERGFDALLSGYDRMLVIALRHRFVTLMTMLATVAVTAWLFIVIPKGFFPEQDTGLILGVTEAAQDVSPDGMAALQQSVIAAVEKDPAVATVGAYIGAGGATSTENQGRVFIALKPRNQRPEIGQVMAQIDQETRGITGVRLFMQPVQDVNIGGRLTATQYQVHADRCRSERAEQVGTGHRERAGQTAAARRCNERSAIRRAAAHSGDQPGFSVAPRHYCSADRCRAVRCLRPATDRAAIHQPQSVLCHHGGETRVPARPQRTATDLRALADLRDGAVERVGHATHDGVTAVRQPPGSVPVGDDQLQPEGQCAAGSGGVGDPASDGNTARAADHQRQLSGQCAGVSELPEQHADIDPGGVGGGLYHPGDAI